VSRELKIRIAAVVEDLHRASALVAFVPANRCAGRLAERPSRSWATLVVRTDGHGDHDELAALSTANAVMTLVSTADGIRLVGEGSEICLHVADCPT